MRLLRKGLVLTALVLLSLWSPSPVVADGMRGCMATTNGLGMTEEEAIDDCATNVVDVEKYTSPSCHYKCAHTLPQPFGEGCSDEYAGNYEGCDYAWHDVYLGGWKSPVDCLCNADVPEGR